MSRNQPIYISINNNKIVYTKKIEDITDPAVIFETLSFCPELKDKNPADFIVFVDFDENDKVVGIEVI